MAFLLRQMRLTRRSIRAYSVFLEDPGPDYGAFGVETSTGSTWRDGREIFRKVIDMGTLADGSGGPTQTSVNHNIPGLLQVVRTWGIFVNATPTWRNLPFSDGETPANDLRIDVNTVVIAVHINADYSSFTAFTVIEYTRS